MEPHFIINLGGLDKLGFTEKEFLELLDIDFKKAVPTSEEFKFGCPKCKRNKVDSYFIYHQYKDFKFGKDADFSFDSIDYHLCICGCLYVFMSRQAHHNLAAKKKMRNKNEKI